MPSAETLHRTTAAFELCVGMAAALSPRTLARVYGTLLVQLPDQLAFLHAFRARSIPRATAVAAMATSGAIVAAGLAARRQA